MNSINTKVKKVRFIKKENYEKIDKAWDLLSNNAQLLIINIFNEAEQYQNTAIERAYENDPNFKNKFISKLDKVKKDAMKDIEKNDEEILEDIDGLLIRI